MPPCHTNLKMYLIDPQELSSKVESEMEIHPLNDRVVVKRLGEDEQRQGSLHLLVVPKEQPQEGQVIAVGEGNRLEDGTIVPLDVRVGDRILFGRYVGSDIKVGGNEYLIMRQDEILGILTHAALSRAPGENRVDLPLGSSRSVKRSQPNIAKDPEPLEFSMPELVKEIRDLIPDAERWLNTPNGQLRGHAPSELVGTPEENLVRNLLREIKYIAIS